MVTQVGVILAQQLADARPRRSPRRAAERDEGVERAAVEHARAGRRDPEQAGLFQQREVEHRLTDRYAGAGAGVGRGAEDAVGQVVQRKVRVGADLDPRARRHSRRGHHALPVKCLVSPCQQAR